MHDVFVAYHSTYGESGSCKVAETVTKYLQDQGLNVFFYPQSKEDTYKTNIFDVIESKLLLFVCNENIRRKDKHIDHSQHYELSVELDSFYSTTFLPSENQNKKEISDAKILFCGKFNYDFLRGDESNLHELFYNRTHLIYDNSSVESSLSSVYEWVIDRLKRKKISEARRVTNEVKRVYSRRSSMQAAEKLDVLVAESKRIVSIGISNSDISNRIDKYSLEEALISGAEIEIYFLDPDGEYTKAREKEENFTDRRIYEITKSCINSINNWKNCLSEDLQSRISLYVYDCSPRINLIIIDEKFFLQFYGFASKGEDSPSFVCEKEQNNSPVYDYCNKAYEHIKSISRRLEI